jgi:murein DD-endopeptidase MepM/ murein hydrolase activator NlpD
MAEAKLGWRCAAPTAAAVLLAALLAGCGGGPPAPVINGEASGMIGEPPIAASMLPPPARPAAPVPPRDSAQIVVQPGQSVGRLAEQYHVPVRDIIAANHLPPPYKIEIGQRLLIPGAAERGSSPERMAAVPAVPSPPADDRLAPRTAERSAPEIIPLDGPPPAAAMTPIAPQRRQDARQQEAPDRAAERPPDGSLPWPVRGRILASYGAAAGGRRNDGINIAAQRGAPVRAVDGGVVAYAGNQLRGYGNLVLIKHPDGFISAYAHCERLLVHRGEQVAQGQVIARVGATGGVAEPQLHFELRNGERAVDPREFLAPAPSAAGRAAAPSG